MEISKSDIIISLAGRDAGQLFYVLDVQDEYVLIVDGKGRKLENPKRKKLKHVRGVSRTDSRVAQKISSGEKLLNSELRRDLAKFGQEFTSQNQGG